MDEIDLTCSGMSYPEMGVTGSEQYNDIRGKGGFEMNVHTSRVSYQKNRITGISSNRTYREILGTCPDDVCRQKLTGKSAFAMELPTSEEGCD